MTDAPSLPLPERTAKHRAAARSGRRSALIARDAEAARRIDSSLLTRIAQRCSCANAAPFLPAEIVSGSDWTVTVDPPPTDREPVTKFLSLANAGWYSNANTSTSLSLRTTRPAVTFLPQTGQTRNIQAA